MCTDNFELPVTQNPPAGGVQSLWQMALLPVTYKDTSDLPKIIQEEHKGNLQKPYKFVWMLRARDISSELRLF